MDFSIKVEDSQMGLSCFAGSGVHCYFQTQLTLEKDHPWNRVHNRGGHSSGAEAHLYVGAAYSGVHLHVSSVQSKAIGIALTADCID